MLLFSASIGIPSLRLMRFGSACMRKLFISGLVFAFALLSATASAAPMAYSVNSDQPLGDTLHQIDLTSGSASPIGISVSAFGVVKTDIEGLTISPDLSLWGVDEDSLKLFQIDTSTGAVVPDSELSLSGLYSGRANDFGLTFTCFGQLYATSVTSQVLYEIDRFGHAEPVGEPGNLGVNISAIAAHGNNPVKIYGLGNGLLGDEGPADNRSLYEIDPESGVATVIGDIGLAPAPYTQAGLSFDNSGKLWAITDRSANGQFSEILSIDTQTGLATVEATATVSGFESLAIAPPVGCASPEDIPPGHIIPTLDGPGKLLAILVLMLAGFASLRHRFS